MREQKRRLAVLLLSGALAFPATGLAGAVNPSAANPVKGTAEVSVQSLAASVDHHYNSLRSLRVEFSQQYAGMGMNRHESGTLLLKKPGRMRWIYSQPAGKLFVLDGKYAYFYGPGDTQVQRVAAKQLDDLRSPLRFLLGHTQLEKELIGLTATPSGTGYVLSGTPKGMEKRIERMSLEVTPDGVIHAMKIEEVDGALTTFKLSGEQTNPPTSDAEFVFQAPKGVPVVEGLPPV
ncbi:MAG TPA: outer membrane lipoprotein chaperone LolA [Acidisarcina sp.]|nr:outer membrane lipoprotein chaperone LolA [Acidisarcina sp.]